MPQSRIAWGARNYKEVPTLQASVLSTNMNAHTHCHIFFIIIIIIIIIIILDKYYIQQRMHANIQHTTHTCKHTHYIHAYMHVCARMYAKQTHTRKH